MNLDSLSITLSQISYLVANLSKRNYKTCVQEIAELISSQGQEADRYLLRCLLSEVDLNSDSIRTPNSKDFQQVQLLAQECAILLRKPSLISILVNAVDKTVLHNNIKNPAQLLPNLSKILKLTLVQEVVFGLTLLHSSFPAVSESALQFIKQKLPILIQNYSVEDTKNAKVQEGGLHDSTPEVLHFILTYLFTPKDQSFLGITPETKEIFLKSLRRGFSRELVPVVLAPLLYPSINYDFEMDNISHESMIMTNNMVDESLHTLIMEVGYGFCSTIEDGRQHMSTLGMRDLAPSVVARILIMMVRTHSGIDDLPCSTFWATTESNSEKSNLDPSSSSSSSMPNGWNIEVFVQVLKEYSPNMSWLDVIRELDNGDLIVKDRPALTLLFNALRLGLQSQGYHPDRFPVDLIYRHWKHTESQFTVINQILKNPDIFCFADYTLHSIAIDMLKAAPETDNKEIATWRSLDLIELLLHFAERGMASQAQEVLKFPVQNCPDILVLGIIQINQPLTMFRQELLTNLIPLFLANHPNSAVILHHAWHSQIIAIKQIVMHCMADWYIRGDSDQTRLSRILDVAHDLKALSLLLNAQTFPFVIDLACLASRREYLKLEKWITDKIRDHGEVFVSALVKFLQRRCPQLFGGTYKDEAFPKATHLPQDTVVTILTCLQACSGNVSPDVAEAILNLITNCNILVNKTRQPPPGVLRTHRNLEPSFNHSALFSSGAQQMDTLGGMGSSLANLNLGGPQTSATFNLPASLGSLVSTPGSPSRVIGPSQNTSYQLLPHLTGGTIGTQVNHGPMSLVTNSMAAINSLARITPQSNQIEKLRIGEGSTVSSVPEFSGQVSKEVEDEANSYFQRIYNHPPHPTLTPDEVIELLKKFHQSPVKREREVFACMIRNLFEEYKFFHQYPDKELYITAQLFGGILAQGLLSQTQLFATGLKYILDALRKPCNIKMYSFGLGALDQLKPILKDIPKMCEYVMNLSGFADLPASLIEYVEYGLQGQEPPHKIVSSNVAALISSPLFKSSTAAPGSAGASPAAKVAAASTRPSIANATNIDTLLVATEKNEKMIIPPESLQDKVAFTFNNLSQLNLPQKSEELREVIREEHYSWLAQYLVMKRASIELNFHPLYSNFLDSLKMPDLDKLILIETFRNIKVLLRSDKSIANFSDRTLLKNLGHWLGMLTLAKGKPILMEDIDIPMLLVEAYQKGLHEMLYVVPFVAKVLESCIKSPILKPPNPWTLTVMCVLSEIHEGHDLKLNLKFEIEVLCKTLQLDLKDLKPRNLLKEGFYFRYMTCQLSHVPKNQSTPPPILPTPLITQPSSSTHNAIPAAILPQAPVVSIPSSSAPSPAMVNQNSSEDLIFPMGQMPLTSSVSSPIPPTSQCAEPKYNLVNFNVNTVPAFGAALVVNGQLPLFIAHPALKQCVRPVVERAIQEWLTPVVERSVKIAVNTSQQIVKTDFALDPEESRIRAAAHYMVRSLSAGMAMITCRDQIINTFTLNLKNTFYEVLLKGETNHQKATPQQKELVEQAISTFINDNVDLACAFVQKQTIDKAVVEVDKQLLSEYEKRKNARNEGRRYCDSTVLTYQAERMPEQIRLKVGGVTQSQMAVYEDFARNIPGFHPLTDREAALFTPKLTIPQFVVQSSNVTDENSSLYDRVTHDLDMYIQSFTTPSQIIPNPQVSHVYSLMDGLCAVRRSGTRDSAMATNVLHKALDGLLDSMAQVSSDPDTFIRYRDFYLRILKSFQDPRSFGIHWTNQKVTKILTESRDEYHFNLEVMELLLRSHLINLPQYDAHLAQAMENGLNYSAVAFATQFVQRFLVDDRGQAMFQEQDFPNTVENLYRVVSHTRNPPDGLSTLLDILRGTNETLPPSDRVSNAATAYIHSGILQSRECDDPPGLLEKTEILLREWVNIYQGCPSGKDHIKVFGPYVQHLSSQGFLKTDDIVTRFLRLSVQMVIDLYYRLFPVPGLAARLKVHTTIDAYTKLIMLLIKHSGDSSNTATKLNLLNKVLGIISGVLLQDHEVRNTDFHQIPYHRIFSTLFAELNVLDSALEPINFQILQSFAHTYHILRPSKVPGFAYSWLELISHRGFITRVLALTPHQRGWSLYAQLIIDLFKFLAPFIRNAELAKPILVYYKGTLRVLLVLLHDFPEFLCDYHYGFCDVIPPNCIQLRNLILSAFPRAMRLPDPFTPNLKVEQLVEITQPPRILPSYISTIQPPSFKAELDSYLKARAPVTFLSELRTNLQSSDQPGSKYNSALMNALVLYVGTQAIHEIRNKNLNPNMSTITHSAHMDIFQNLAVDLDTEGRYVFVNAIANQLRYPNSHTHYFSCTLLYLFAEANTEVIQEQITRVLLERIIVNRPHPWGLLITFIELIKNPVFKFWEHEFVHCAPEIEKLFESVAHSCVGRKQPSIAESEISEI